MSHFVDLLSAGAAAVLGLDGTTPPAVSIVTKDATPAASIGWWVLPLICGGVGLVVGLVWWWWRQADALKRDPAAWAADKLLAKEPREARKALRQASKASGVPLLALLMSPSTAQQCMEELTGKAG
ncbi:MAG: hypothetical protein WC718_15375 [Phycisphaerales bacterium]|jgi:hypothetical protein